MQNEIQTGRWNAILHKLLSMKEGAPSPTLATDVFPTVVLESERPEWSYLAGERLCFGRWSDAAVAGNYSAVGLRNPVGSGVLVVCEAIDIFVGATSQWYIGMRSNSTVDAANPGFCRDSRLATQKAVGEVTERTQVAVPVYPMYKAIVLVSTTAHYREPIILSPGWEILCHALANTEIQGNFSWRERALEPSETR
jgi:hypothetical protein